MILPIIMDRWTELKGWMEEALEIGNFVEALSHLDTFMASCSTEDLRDCKLLSDHTLKELPTLHYLARFHYTQKDIARLDKLINVFIDLGYDINTATDNSLVSRRMKGLDSTALMAAIEKENLILLECLLRNGARTDVRDPQGFTPCHSTVRVGNVKCLQKIIQFGGPSVLATTSIEKDVEIDVHPILHTAAGNGQTEVVSYLLSKAEELGMNVNEVAIYKNYFSMDDHYHYCRYVIEAYTPLGNAVRWKQLPIVQLLLKHPEVKLSGFNELHLCFETGYTEIALILLECFSDEQLVSDKICDFWALHTLPASAFYKEPHVEFTKKLILEYVRRGWDVNSMGTSPLSWNLSGLDVWETDVTPVRLTKYTLLHLACLSQAGEQIIRGLLEEARADVNSTTEGDIEMTPLHISLMLKEWKSAEILVENGADMSIRGKFSDSQFTCCMRKDFKTGRAFENLNPCPNSLELLVRMGSEEGLPLLEKVLVRTDVVWDGANEFILALEGGNPVYISKVLEHCAKTISKEELSWITHLDPWEIIHKTTPTLAWLINFLIKRGWTFREKFVNMPALAHLIKCLASLGYDFCLCGEWSTVNDLLTIDIGQDSSNLLLRTLLQIDHFKLQLPNNRKCENPVERVLFEYSSSCGSNFPKCFEDKTFPSPCMETVSLLISHGLDVTEMVIKGFHGITYHFGYNVILKMLYCAGAKFSDEFFTSPSICHESCSKTKAIFAEEIAELKLWKYEFDHKAGCSLKHMCRLTARKSLRCVGDLKMLDKLPKYLRDYVLCKQFI